MSSFRLGRKQGDNLPLAEAAEPRYARAIAEGLGGFRRGLAEQTGR
ncbi:MAG: hypothetical protein ACK5IP_15830 [Paracoccus sp. (in: a-proteobacteria)]